MNEVSDFVARAEALPKTDISLSASSVSRILAANGIKRKVSETCFISRSELTRAQWVHSEWSFLCARVLMWMRPTTVVSPPNVSGPGCCEECGPSATSPTIRD